MNQKQKEISLCIYLSTVFDIWTGSFPSMGHIVFGDLNASFFSIVLSVGAFCCCGCVWFCGTILGNDELLSNDVVAKNK